MKVRFPCFVLLLSLGFMLPVAAQPNPDAKDWRLRKNENGISVYSRKEEGLDVEAMKMVAVVEGSLSSVLAVFIDVAHYPDWILNCEEGKLLKKVSDTEQYQYQVNSLPYPLSDRDIAIRFTVTQDTNTLIVKTHSVGVPAYIPEAKGKVRMPVFDGGYRLKPLPGNKVEVVYSLRLDPGGSIPDWVVNWFIVAGPYESTLKLREQVKKPEYKSVKLGFIRELQ